MWSFFNSLNFSLEKRLIEYVQTFHGLHWFLSILSSTIKKLFTLPLFLPLDIQTPSSPPTSGKYNVFFFNSLSVSLGENFNWVCPNFYKTALNFINPFFYSYEVIYFTTLLLPLDIPNLSSSLTPGEYSMSFFSIFSMSVLEQILTVSKIT